MFRAEDGVRCWPCAGWWALPIIDVGEVSRLLSNGFASGMPFGIAKNVRGTGDASLPERRAPDGGAGCDYNNGSAISSGF